MTGSGLKGGNLKVAPKPLAANRGFSVRCRADGVIVPTLVRLYVEQGG